MTTPEAASRPFDAGRFSFGNTKSLSTPPEKFASRGVISSGANRATLQGRLGLILIRDSRNRMPDICPTPEFFRPGNVFSRQFAAGVHSTPFISLPHIPQPDFSDRNLSACWTCRGLGNADSAVLHSAADQDWRVPGRRKPPSRRTCLAPPPKRRSLPGVPSKGRFSARPSNLSRPTS